MDEAIPPVRVVEPHSEPDAVVERHISLVVGAEYSSEFADRREDQVALASEQPESGHCQQGPVVHPSSPAMDLDRLDHRLILLPPYCGYNSAG